MNVTRQKSVACELLSAVDVDSSDALRYVDAEHLETSAGTLDDVVLVSPTNAKLGKLDGVVINPFHRRVYYYVVKAGNWVISHRYLVPAMPARLEPERKALRVDVEPDDLKRLPEADLRMFARFSDLDIVDAMFAPHAHA